MKEDGRIKIGIGGVICTILIIVLIGCVGYLLYQVRDLKGQNEKKTVENERLIASQKEMVNQQKIENTTDVNTVAEQNKTEKSNNKVGKIDESKDWIYTDKEKNGSKKPYVNISSNSAKKINAEIEEEFDKSIKEGTPIFSYNYYINDNIISLVIKRGYDNDVRLYTVYNIDKELGNSVSNTEIMHSKSINRTKFEEILKTACDKEYKENAKNNIDERSKTEASIINSTNISMYTPIFLDENGDINAVIRQCTFAGAEYYYFIVNLEK